MKFVETIIARLYVNPFLFGGVRKVIGWFFAENQHFQI